MKAQIVSFRCVMKNRVGAILGTTFNQDVLADVNTDTGPLKALAGALQGLKPGEKKRVFLRAEQAYGYYDPKRLISLPRSRFEPGTLFTLGQQVELREDSGRKRELRVAEIGASTVTLDGNHPLAGQDLEFEIEAVSAREATREEILEAQADELAAYLH